MARISLVVEQYKIKPHHMMLVEPITSTMLLGPDIPFFEVILEEWPK